MREVPCYICRKAVVAHSNLAIVKLCSEHDTAENREKMKNATYNELMKIYNWFIEHGGGRDNNDNPTPPKPEPPKKKKKIIGKNEWGEPIYEE